MSEKTPFDEVALRAARNREQVIKVIEEHIRELDLHLGEMPAPTDPINGKRYIKWERLGMSWIGQVKGQLELAQLLGIIAPEQYQRLKQRAMAGITRLTAQMVMTGKGVR